MEFKETETLLEEMAIWPLAISTDFQETPTELLVKQTGFQETTTSFKATASPQLET